MVVEIFDKSCMKSFILFLCINNSNKMTVKPIKTERDYTEALQRLEVIFDAKKNSAAGDELEVLGILIEKYEDEHFPIFRS